MTKKQNNKNSKWSYHLLVPLLFHYWHDESRDNSPLDVQDVDRLIILGVEFDISLSFNCDLQGVPVDVDRLSFTTCHFSLSFYVLNSSHFLIIHFFSFNINNMDEH